MSARRHPKDPVSSLKTLKGPGGLREGPGSRGTGALPRGKQ